LIEFLKRAAERIFERAAEHLLSEYLRAWVGTLPGDFLIIVAVGIVALIGLGFVVYFAKMPFERSRARKLQVAANEGDAEAQANLASVDKQPMSKTPGTKRNSAEQLDLKS
jgi:hypothetical protein